MKLARADGGRSSEEWVADHADQAIPPRVKLRVWERCGGRCALTNRKLRPGDAYDFDHILALANGGQHREGNLQLVARDAHKQKTKLDVASKAKADRIRKKALGLWPPPVRKLQGRPFPKRGDGGNSSKFNRAGQSK